jgi:hypothetical protein
MTKLDTLGCWELYDLLSEVGLRPFRDIDCWKSARESGKLNLCSLIALLSLVVDESASGPSGVVLLRGWSESALGLPLISSHLVASSSSKVRRNTSSPGRSSAVVTRGAWPRSMGLSVRVFCSSGRTWCCLSAPVGSGSTSFCR